MCVVLSVGDAVAILRYEGGWGGIIAVFGSSRDYKAGDGGTVGFCGNLKSGVDRGCLLVVRKL